MYTNNRKVSAIRKVIALGFEINMRETKSTKAMIISVTLDGKEIWFSVDKTINSISIKGTALNAFVEKVDSGFFTEKEENV